MPSAGCPDASGRGNPLCSVGGSASQGAQQEWELEESVEDPPGLWLSEVGFLSFPGSNLISKTPKNFKNYLIIFE